jgi:hypothetical protein
MGTLLKNNELITEFITSNANMDLLNSCSCSDWGLLGYDPTQFSRCVLRFRENTQPSVFRRRYRTSRWNSQGSGFQFYRASVQILAQITTVAFHSLKPWKGAPLRDPILSNHGEELHIGTQYSQTMESSST